MRKKLLSLLTVLCLVLGMLPATAMAAATEAYEKNEVAQIITTDTEITEDVDGLVLVDAPCKVTVTDAKLSVGIVVSPDAAGAEVVLNGTTESAEVVVLASASVKVEATANAGAVTVDAAEVKLDVAGTAEVALTENATDTTVTAAEGAAVTVDAAKGATVTVDVAAGAKAEVKVAEGATAAVTAAEGSTVALDVAEGATASIDVAEGAEVSVTAADPDAVEVTGAGADSVTINNTSASDEEEEKKDEEEDKKDDAKEEETPNFDFAGPTTQSKAVKICWSNQGDNDALSGTHTLNGVTMNDTNQKTTSVTVNAEVQADGSAKGSVNITADALKQHKNGNNIDGYWIGFGVELPAKEEGTYTETTSASDDSSPYKYYVIEKTATDPAWETTGAYTRVYQVGEDFFNTLYFDLTPPVNSVQVALADDGEGGGTVTAPVEGDGENEDDEPPQTENVHKEYIVVVTTGVTPNNNDPIPAETEGAQSVTIESGTPNLTIAADEEIVYIFDVTVDATVVEPAEPAE